MPYSTEAQHARQKEKRGDQGLKDVSSVKYTVCIATGNGLKDVSDTGFRREIEPVEDVKSLEAVVWSQWRP